MVAGAGLTIDGGRAATLVHSAYGALDLFDGSDSQLLAWAQGLTAGAAADTAVPSWFAGATSGALIACMAAAGVIGHDGALDAYNLGSFQQVVALLPHFRAEEIARRPAAVAQVVFTVPPSVRLPEQARHLQRSLSDRVFEALTSATDRVLLASPYWSDRGSDNLWDGLGRARDHRLPVTLAGARHDDGREDLPAMLRLAARLRAEDVPVTVLRYQPPVRNSLFHAKFVCGAEGYLGSANLTGSGLGDHVEAGLPLSGEDVGQVWWLIEMLQDSGLLVAA